MLTDDDLGALVRARHPDPFAILGVRADARGQWWVRAFLPNAEDVELVDAAGERVVVLDRRHPAGVWESPLVAPVEDYRLRVRWDSGVRDDYADPYSFGPLLDEAGLRAFSEGRHLRPCELLGAHPTTLGEGDRAVAGGRFAVWAPRARRVSVVGDFNNWDGRRHLMRRRDPSGVWELFVPHMIAGDRYKYELVGPDDALQPLKADPYAFAAQLRPDTASIVAPLPERRALPPWRARANDRHAPISVYEVHPGSWRRADGRFKTWDELAEELPAYASDLGFTHVELMPITEFPFDGSWGYQTLGLYAPTARFGDPQAFQRFVDACHARGIGVLLDWVPAHFPIDAHGLSRFDGTALYEYEDPREGFHRDWNTLIYDFGRPEVRCFLAGSALYWIERFGVDGLRVDAVASMIYRDYSRSSGEWLPNRYGGRENIEAIELLKHINEVLVAEAPGAITLAEESTTFPRVSHPTYAGGLGFHFKWNMGWMHDTLLYMRQPHVQRRLHHDKLTFGLVYAFDENFILPLSHDEVVHGKGSLIARMPGDDGQRFANLRAYFAFMWAHPGKKLLFMGQEFAQDTEWDYDSELPWHLLGQARNAGVQRLVRDLNRAYREERALHRQDCDAFGFEWIASTEATNSLLAWIRRDTDGDAMIAVCNMTPVPQFSYVLGVPEGPTGWREVLNTDSAYYGGSNVGNASAVLPVEAVASHGRSQSIRMVVPPLATVYLLPA
ncbi:MAG: 1,4-alpha-glucan branching protein GlgB [Burkholderiaceae bacterium]